MNEKILQNHIKQFMTHLEQNPEKYQSDFKERIELTNYYQSFAAEKILSMTEENVYEYLSKLWAMRIWGNKRYVVDKILADNGIKDFRASLADLLWGKSDIAKRWDAFRSNIKGMGPGMISEILCKTHPFEYMLWNRRAYISLAYLEVESLPRYDYQLTGLVYKDLCAVCQIIAGHLKKAGYKDTSLLAVDYFIWDELQVEDNLTTYKKKSIKKKELKTTEVTEFIHNDIRDKISDIGQWLGFTSNIEQKVSEGSKVDTIWEATIGNMGRVIYVFEVQTKGSIDSLILNLLKSLNNPAVQGVVAVSDSKQIETIKKHALDVKNLSDKLKYWDYEEVLKVHESLEFVNATINNLSLVPEGF